MAYQYDWFFKGIVQEIIDGRTLKIWVDTGFDNWKIVPVKFNRLRVVHPVNPKDKTATIKYLETNLKRKKIYLGTFKQKDKFDNDRYFAEIYMDSGEDTPTGELTLRDINKALKEKNQFDIKGLININDLLVKKGLAEYV